LWLFNPDPKYKSQLLVKTCRDVVQQGENKGRWKERTEQANNTDFSIFLNFSLIFPKGTNRNQTFLFFHYFFYNFLWTRIKKMPPQKLAPTTEVGCGLQKYSTFSEKRAKTLKFFFLFFLEFFLQFWWNQTRWSNLLLSVGNSCEMNQCW
jgi:hypothetical protein